MSNPLHENVDIENTNSNDGNNNPAISVNDSSDNAQKTLLRTIYSIGYFVYYICSFFIIYNDAHEMSKSVFVSGLFLIFPTIFKLLLEALNKKNLFWFYCLAVPNAAIAIISFVGLLFLSNLIIFDSTNGIITLDFFLLKTTLPYRCLFIAFAIYLWLNFITNYVVNFKNSEL